METPTVRFDDLSPGGAGSFGLIDRTEIMVARRLDEVVPVLRAAEQAARDGNWVAGFVSYEAAPALNSLLPVRPAGLHDPMRELPLVLFHAYSTRVELEDIESTHPVPGSYSVSGWTPNASRRDYGDSLAAHGRAIMAGEVARLKHTFRLRAAFSGEPAALYRDLLLAQRGTHAACLDVGRFRLLSASPEGFCRRTGNTLTVNPVLASVRRGRYREEDEQLSALLSAKRELSYSDRVVVKEIEAELAEIGTLAEIPVADRLTVTRLETLWHLTAMIGADLFPGVGLLEIFKALFPPVSVTGVPKPEAMGLIARTEDTPRGAYCGAIGYLAPPGADGPEVSFSVAVRTVVVDQEEGVAEFGVGTPITNRYDVISAYEEARLKAKVLVERRPEFRLMECFRVENGVVRAAEAKVDSLMGSAEYFGFGADRAGIAGALHGSGELPGSSRLTLFMDRWGRVQVEVEEAPPWAETPEEAQGAAPELVGVVAEKPVSTDNVFLYHHTTHPRLREAMARYHPHADVVVLVNEKDEVAGTLEGNLMAFIDGTWLTPPRDCGTALWAMRERLIENGRAIESVVTRAQLSRAERLAVVDDLHGWRLLSLAG